MIWSLAPVETVFDWRLSNNGATSPEKTGDMFLGYYCWQREESIEASVVCDYFCDGLFKSISSMVAFVAEGLVPGSI